MRASGGVSARARVVSVRVLVCVGAGGRFGVSVIVIRSVIVCFF